MIAREQLEKDLQSVRSQLLQKGQNGHFSSNEVESRSRMDSGRRNYQEYDVCIKVKQRYGCGLNAIRLCCNGECHVNI